MSVEDAAAALDLASWKEGLRSDAAASGLVVMVPTVAAAVAFAKEVAAGRATITWAALVQGRVDRESELIDKPLGPDRRKPGMVRVYEEDKKRARPAQTQVDIVERFVRHTLVHAIPRTDRGHQLRAHLAATHHPVVGDEDYGGKATLKISAIKRDYKVKVGMRERPMLERLCLHATRVSIERPTGPLVFDSPLPYEIEKALVRLRRYATK
jgi:23S rRNA pseudouridine1911/1915/1917 synthase